MQIPEKVKIGGYAVEVKKEDNLTADRGHLGEYFPRTQTIKIESGCSKQQREETFVHELLEAIKDIYDIELEHRDLTLMATVLHQVIKDNPEIFKE